MLSSTEKTLREFRSLKNLSPSKYKKRKNESDRDYVFRMANYKCTYCDDYFEKKDLRLVQIDPNKFSASKIKSHICACKDCAEEKGSMSDKEYRHFRTTKKRLVREEIIENYAEIAPRVFARYDHKCIYCIAEFGHMPKNRKLTIDHKIPVSKGGTNEEANLCCACEQHNKKKGDKTAQYFLEQIERKKRRKKVF